MRVVQRLMCGAACAAVGVLGVMGGCAGTASVGTGAGAEVHEAAWDEVFRENVGAGAGVSKDELILLVRFREGVDRPALERRLREALEAPVWAESGGWPYEGVDLIFWSGSDSSPDVMACFFEGGPALPRLREREFWAFVYAELVNQPITLKTWADDEDRDREIEQLLEWAAAV